jgi:hypothetical protein
VAGHKNVEFADDPSVLEQTKQYLRDVIKLLADSSTPEEFFDAMMAIYPDRINPSPLWYGGVALLNA